MSLNHVVPRLRVGLVLVGAIALFALAGCGSSSSSSSASATSSAAPSGASSSTAASTSAAAPVSTSTSACGPKPGVAATGTPINIGTIDTKQPGTDFSDGPNMITAYYNCVNANGGVNGHPVKLFVQYDQTQPSQVAAAAKQLIQSDHVVGIVGVFDLLECTIDQHYWQQLGIYEMGAGIAPECWSTPNSAAVNMGPATARTAPSSTGSPTSVQGRVRAVQRPGHGLHRGRSGRARRRRTSRSRS